MMGPQEDITTFAGFGSWMSTFTPQQRHEPPVAELDSYSPVHGVKFGGAVELPADDLEKPYLLDSKSIHAPEPPPVNVIEKKVVTQHRPVFREVPDPTCRIEVRGLQKHGGRGLSSDVVSTSSYCFLSDINSGLQRKGYRPAVAFISQTGSTLPISVPVGQDEGSWPVLITTGKSCYDPEIGLRMHVDEPFTAFFSRLQMSVRCADSQLLINNGDLKITFHRTLRVPEDGRIHMLPASFGRFPVQNLAAYSKKLNASNNPSLMDMANKSGVFFPMFQREAMWISFDSRSGSEYRVRVFVGGINVVSGKKWDEPKSPYSDDQDYILVPPQEHLDGIAIGNGVVRQFIAMPIGSGYSIEKQLTGKEDVGGVQLEITPYTPKMKLFRFDGSMIMWEDQTKSNTITPRFYNLSAGENIMMKRWSSGLPLMGGKLQKTQKKTLLELIDGTGPSAAITALYDVKMQIAVPGKMLKHKVETAEFSPFATIEEVARKTTFRGKDLTDYELWYEHRPLPSHSTILESGLHESQMPVLVAKPKRPMGSSGGRHSHPRPGAIPSSTSEFYGTRISEAPIAHGASPKVSASVVSSPCSPQGAPPGYGAAVAYGSSPVSPVYQQQGVALGARPGAAPGAVHNAPVSYGASPASAVNTAPIPHSAPPQQAPQPGAPPGVAPGAVPGAPVKAKPPPDQESWAMGLGAGGKLRQQIYKDHDIYRTTNMKNDATALISIQLLNAVAFEAITGMVCPPTPITLQNYVEAGIPWFDTYKDFAASTEGDKSFAKIQSVSEIDSSKQIYEGTSVAETRNVACTVCRRNFCDCILRPCSHSFCAGCVRSRMVHRGRGMRDVIECWECRTVATQMLGFSAPMALPGEEEFYPDFDTPVSAKAGTFDKAMFAAELE